QKNNHYRWFFKDMNNLSNGIGKTMIDRWYAFAKKFPRILFTSNRIAVFHAAPPSALDPNWKDNNGIQTLATSTALRDQITYGLVKTDGSEDRDLPNEPDRKPFFKEIYLLGKEK